MDIKANATGYCGLCCTICFNRKGEIADLARDLRKIRKQGTKVFVSKQK